MITRYFCLKNTSKRCKYGCTEVSLMISDLLQTKNTYSLLVENMYVVWCTGIEKIFEYRHSFFSHFYFAFS